MKTPLLELLPALPKTRDHQPRSGSGILAAFLLLALTFSGLKGDGILLRNFDLSPDGGLAFRLPPPLEEISGLALAPDGRLFAHNDERAVFYQVDPETGGVIKRFSAGLGGVPGDFEGIAIAGKRFYLMTSGGEILETEEGSPGSAMSYRVHQTDLGRRCELEGLAFDPEEETLLLPCKEPRDRELRDHIVVFSIPVRTMRPLAVPRIFLPLEELKAFGMDDSFFPAGIEVHPETGGILLVSAREEAILELGPRGTLLEAMELRRKNHPQTEGITFLGDGSLLLADEGQGRRGRLTRYPPSLGSGGVP